MIIQYLLRWMIIFLLYCSYYQNIMNFMGATIGLQCTPLLLFHYIVDKPIDHFTKGAFTLFTTKTFNFEVALPFWQCLGLSILNSLQFSLFCWCHFNFLNFKCSNFNQKCFHCCRFLQNLVVLSLKNRSCHLYVLNVNAPFRVQKRNKSCW